MFKVTTCVLAIVSILVGFAQASLDISCDKVIPSLPDYECFGDKPVGSSLESVSYTIREKSSQMIRILKVSKTETLKPEQNPEIAFLTVLQSVPQVVTLYQPSLVLTINSHILLVEILEYAKFGDLDKFMDLNTLHFNDHERLIRFSLDLVAGLKEIHAKGIIHASVKPQNIIVTDDFNPKFINFDSSVPIGSNNYSRGDHLFNAPEVLLNRGYKIDWDVTKDIYSLGVVFYYLVHKTVPFTGPTRYFQRRAVERKRFLIKDGIGEDFLFIIQRCMKWNPKDRSSLDSIAELLIRSLNTKISPKLPKYKMANLDNDSLEEVGLIEVDPLIIIMAAGCLIISIVLIMFMLGLSGKQKVVAPSTRTELVSKENNL